MERVEGPWADEVEVAVEVEEEEEEAAAWEGSTKTD